MNQKDIGPLIQQNNDAKIFKRHFKTFLSCFREATY